MVAAITPIAGDDADTPAHWGVTFSTEDADATAAKAAELGGTVLVAPVDAPYSRLTVPRDPQGATFSATAFVPENKDIGRVAAHRDDDVTRVHWAEDPCMPVPKLRSGTRMPQTHAMRQVPTARPELFISSATRPAL